MSTRTATAGPLASARAHPPWVATLLRWPPVRRLRERGFWVVQLLVLAITALHFLSESSEFDEPYGSFHHIPVTLYIVPVIYAGLKYGTEGGVLTALWSAFLSVPNFLLWHSSGLMWVGELVQVIVVGVTGLVLAGRVDAERRERHRAERAGAALQVSEQRYRTLFEHAGDAILLVDARGRVIEANAAAAALGGKPAAELAHQSVGEVLGSELQGLVAEMAGSGQSRPMATRLLRFALAGRHGRGTLVEAVATAVAGVSGAVAVQMVVRDVTEQQRRQDNLRHYARQVTIALEEERKRIARELHDDTAQALVRIGHVLDGLGDPRSRLSRADRSRLKEAQDLARGTFDSVRRLSGDLRPPVLDDLGLLSAVRSLVADLAQRQSLDCRLETEGEPRRLAPEAELAIFRITQEALHNVERHACASQVLVIVGFGPRSVRVEVSDNGRGFAVPPEPEDLAASGMLGLLGMRERAQLVGGTLAIHSHPGAGTRVLVEVGDGAYSGGVEAQGMPDLEEGWEGATLA